MSELHYRMRAPDLSMDVDRIRVLRVQALDEARRLAMAPEGASSPTVQNALGHLHAALRNDDEALLAFSRALMQQLGPWFGVPLTSEWPFSAAFGRLLGQSTLRSEVAARASARAADRAGVLESLHGLDGALKQWKLGGSGAEGRKRRQKRRARQERVSSLGVFLGLWPHAMHRPLRLTGGRLPSCAVHRSSFYGPLVAALEERTTRIAGDLVRMLRLRADADPDETGRWYPNQEGIAARAEEWMQRHVSCRYHSRSGGAAFEEPTKRICEAIHSAMGWYYAEADADGTPSAASGAASGAVPSWLVPGLTNPDGRLGKPAQYWGRGALSVLGPGQHVRPHTGPTNERVVISLGLAGGLEAAELRVGHARRRWRQGRAIVFDDSFEHEVRVGNASGTPPRAVLIVHVLHPQLMPPGTNGRALASRMEGGEACEEGDHGFVEWADTEKLADRLGSGGAIA